MDWNRVEGNWKEVKGKIKQKWGQLTDDDLAQINGRRDQLEGKIQQRYGLAKDLVRKDIDDWLDAQPQTVVAQIRAPRKSVAALVRSLVECQTLEPAADKESAPEIRK